MRVFHSIFGFSGRIGRAEYWRVLLFIAALLLLLTIIVALIAVGVGFLRRARGPIDFSMELTITTLLAALMFGAPLSIGRLHDRNKSGWWLIVFALLPILLGWLGDWVSDELEFLLSLPRLLLIGWAFVELACLRGTVGPNRFGPEPTS